jgi:serine/threonine protein kinase SCH9
MSPSASSNPPPVNMTTTTEELTGKLKAAFPSPSNISQEGPPVASLNGKLSVRISEARGLRSSIDPYVVCVFEWNEYISKGAQSEKNCEVDGKQSRERFDNDPGKPMAIPMRSRQSSNNSQLDGYDCKGKVPVTEPRWNHEAILYV